MSLGEKSFKEFYLVAMKSEAEGPVIVDHGSMIMDHCIRIVFACSFSESGDLEKS